MEEKERSLFRANAVRYYQQQQNEAVLPRLVSPHTVRYLWILLVLLTVGGGTALFTAVPVYASSSAVVVDGKNQNPSVAHELVMVAFIDPQYQSHLQIGQKVILQADTDGQRLSGAIIAMEAKIMSPDSAAQQFALNAGVAQAVTQPSAVAIVRFSAAPTMLPISVYTGSVYHVDIEIGTRRMVSFLPLLGSRAGE